MLRHGVLVFTLLLPVAAACGPDGDTDKQPRSTVCRGDLALGEVEDAAVLGFPTEGIAFSPAGRLYVSGGSPLDSLYEIKPDGSVEPFAKMQSALGIAFRGDLLYVAGIGSNTVYLVTPAGEVKTFAPGIAAPNFITVTPWGTLLVSNDFTDRIVEIAASRAEVWSTDVPSPNGMVFSSDGARLYVAATFDRAGIYEITVTPGGAPGLVREVLRYGSNPVLDGLAMGADARVYAALNVAGRIERIDPASGASLTIARGLKSPASLAFGEGEFDPCSLYVTELFGKSVKRVGVGVAGEPLFR